MFELIVKILAVAGGGMLVVVLCTLEYCIISIERERIRARLFHEEEREHQRQKWRAAAQ